MTFLVAAMSHQARRALGWFEGCVALSQRSFRDREFGDFYTGADLLATHEEMHEAWEPVREWAAASEYCIRCGSPQPVPHVCLRDSSPAASAQQAAGVGPSEVEHPPAPSEGRPTSELLMDAAELLGKYAPHYRDLRSAMQIRARALKFVEKNAPQGTPGVW